MAYDTQELLAKAEKVIPEKNLVFIQDVQVFLGIATPTFYEHFPKESKNYKRITDLLNQNAVQTKYELRNKWYKSDNATLQVALMKLLGSDQERKRLNSSYVDLTSKDEKISTPTQEVAQVLRSIIESDDEQTEKSD